MLCEVWPRPSPPSATPPRRRSGPEGTDGSDQETPAACRADPGAPQGWVRPVSGRSCRWTGRAVGSVAPSVSAPEPVRTLPFSLCGHGPRGVQELSRALMSCSAALRRLDFGGLMKGSEGRDGLWLQFRKNTGRVSRSKGRTMKVVHSSAPCPDAPPGTASPA